MQNNALELNKRGISLIAQVAKRVMDSLITTNQDSDILAAPKNVAEFNTYNDNINSIIETKLRTALKIN